MPEVIHSLFRGDTVKLLLDHVSESSGGGLKVRQRAAVIAIAMVLTAAVAFILVYGVPTAPPPTAPPIAKADSDGDGLTDDREKTLGTDPHDPDTDNDGLKDGEEVDTYKTSPVDFDTDGDGLGDGEEVTKYQTDPRDPDTDNDGLDDGKEVKSYGTNPSKADTDGDGLNDRVEVENYLTDPLDPDTDGDGLTDGDEVTIYDTDPRDADSDDDGLKDGQEIDKGTNPNDADTDNDGYLDGEDIFPLFDACLEIYMSYWKEWRAGDGIWGAGDPYFVVDIYIYRDGSWILFNTTVIDVEDDIVEAWGLFTLRINIPDDVRYVRIVIDAWDADADADDHYDLNGHDPSLYALEIEYDVLSGSITVEGNGLDDGEEPAENLTDAYAEVIISTTSCS